jgi:carboxypeptidase D
VIEATNNVIIGSGNLDILLPTNGTLFALQNLTWNGQQGFQTYPRKKMLVPLNPQHNGSTARSVNVGSWGTERGLTFYQVQLAGHQLPGHAPGAAYRVIELLVGRINDLSLV